MKIPRTACLFAVIASVLTGTVVPRMAFEEIVAESTKIVHARVLDSRVQDVDGIIWTHYRIQVLEGLKGTTENIVTVSEPGGVLNGIEMRIQGTVSFENGEEDVLFLYQTPIGFWRTTGWSQGKFDVVISSAGKVVRASRSGVELVPNGRAATGQNIDSFNGQALGDFVAAVRRQAGAK